MEYFNTWIQREGTLFKKEIKTGPFYSSDDAAIDYCNKIVEYSMYDELDLEYVGTKVSTKYKVDVSTYLEGLTPEEYIQNKDVEEDSSTDLFSKGDAEFEFFRGLEIELCDAVQ